MADDGTEGMVRRRQNLLPASAFPSTQLKSHECSVTPGCGAGNLRKELAHDSAQGLKVS